MNDQTLQTLDHNVRLLSDDLNHVGHQLDAAEDRGDELAAESLERIWIVKERLLDEARRKLDNYYSEISRRSAEARLAYHAEEDTLDLY